ncbi:MAG TPA: 2OG-Fe(II) oxygenase, partial [Myxococcota bacterium]|nr:2OG-Fe(II) oxygenase [Myxococcota bacterium]
MVSSLFSEATFSRLEALAKANAEIYRTNSPFPHIAIDDFLPADALDGALAEFPNATDIPWIRFDNPEEKKLAFNEIERLPAALRDVFYFMNSAPVLRFLEELTGIEDLLPDPYYVGGGLHNIRRGGHLGVHVDFNRYKRFGIDRRLNMLVYLNRNWDESYGGHLELWDRGMESCVKRIAPIFNRCVVFSTTETSYHGHPEPLTCP